MNIPTRPDAADAFPFLFGRAFIEVRVAMKYRMLSTAIFLLFRRDFH